MTNKGYHDLSESESEVTSGGPQQWVADCPTCGATFTSKEAFRNHASSHPRCGRCGSRFSDYVELGIHALTCHAGKMDD